MATLVLLGADPVADFPDHDLARRALAGAQQVIAIDTHRTASVEAASVVLAAAGPGEVAGTTTNVEGRVLTLAQKVTPPGTARADWQLAAELAFRLGRDLGLESVAGIWEEIERIAPSYAGLTAGLVAWAGGHEGLLMPLDPDQLATLDGARVTIASQRHGIDAGAAAAAGAALAASTHEERQDAELEAKEQQAQRVGDTDAAAGAAAAERPQSERPALLTFRPPDTPTELPAVDAYGLRLVATRTLYDSGTLVSHSPSLRGLAREARVRMHPTDLARLGLGEVADVTISSARGRATLETVADPGLPPGSVGMYVNHRGADPADLIDVTAAATTVQVETPATNGAQ